MCRQLWSCLTDKIWLKYDDTWLTEKIQIIYRKVRMRLCEIWQITNRFAKYLNNKIYHKIRELYND